MNQNLRTFVRGAYDLQKLRIMTGNRIVGNWKAKMGQAPGTAEEEMDPESQKILKDIRISFKKITDAFTAKNARRQLPKREDFVGDEVISDYTELCLVAEYIALEESETSHFKRLQEMVGDYPIYQEFLKDIKGIGPAMAGVIISELDIRKAQYPSSLWQYCGLGVESDGRGTSKRKEHLKDIEYVDKDGNPAVRKGINYNPFIKTKLMGVLASSFLKQADSPYRAIYDDYKHRLESHPKYCDGQVDDKGKAVKGLKGHRHAMAMRYMIKRFLVDLYRVWRPLEGLPAAPEYSEAKLGKTHKVA